MSERILDGLTGADVFNHGAGTSGFHDGDPMQANSARELEERGFDAEGHRARGIERAHVESADLILVATSGHLADLAERFPEAAHRTFLVRQFGLIAADAAAELPEGDAAVRGKVLIALAAERRGGYPAEDLADPWGLSRREYARIADQLEDALEPVADALDGDS